MNRFLHKQDSIEKMVPWDPNAIVIHKGYLKKKTFSGRGVSLAPWRQRYFALTTSHLYYFKDKKNFEQDPPSSISAVTMQEIQQAAISHKDPRRMNLTLQRNSKTFDIKIQGITAEEIAAWSHHIASVIELQNPGAAERAEAARKETAKQYQARPSFSLRGRNKPATPRVTKAAKRGSVTHKINAVPFLQRSAIGRVLDTDLERFCEFCEVKTYEKGEVVAMAPPPEYSKNQHKESKTKELIKQFKQQERSDLDNKDRKQQSTVTQITIAEPSSPSSVLQGTQRSTRKDHVRTASGSNRQSFFHSPARRGTSSRRRVRGNPGSSSKGTLRGEHHRSRPKTAGKGTRRSLTPSSGCLHNMNKPRNKGLAFTFIIEGKIKVMYDEKTIYTKSEGEFVPMPLFRPAWLFKEPDCHPRPKEYKCYAQERVMAVQITKDQLEEFSNRCPDSEELATRLLGTMSELFLSLELFGTFDRCELLFYLVKWKCLRAGDTLYNEGDHGPAHRSMYIVFQGSLRSTSYVQKEDGEEDGDDDEKGPELREMGSYEVSQHVGEVSLLLDAPRSTTMTATSDCVLMELTKECYDAYCTAFPDNEILHQTMKLSLCLSFHKYDLPFYKGLDRRKYRLLSSMVQLNEFKADHHVFNYGDPGQDFWLIAHGEVAVFVPDENGVEREVARMGAGRYFGEVALVTEGARRATVKTTSACVLLSLSKEAFEEFFQKAPEAMADFMLRLGKFNVQIEPVLHHSVGFQAFRKHLEAEYSVENIDFWVACRNYVAIPLSLDEEEEHRLSVVRKSVHNLAVQPYPAHTPVEFSEEDVQSLVEQISCGEPLLRKRTLQIIEMDKQLVTTPEAQDKDIVTIASMYHPSCFESVCSYLSWVRLQHKEELRRVEAARDRDANGAPHCVAAFNILKGEEHWLQTVPLTSLYDLEDILSCPVFTDDAEKELAPLCDDNEEFTQETFLGWLDSCSAASTPVYQAIQDSKLNNLWIHFCSIAGRPSSSSRGVDKPHRVPVTNFIDWVSRNSRVHGGSQEAAATTKEQLKDMSISVLDMPNGLSFDQFCGTLLIANRRERQLQKRLRKAAKKIYQTFVGANAEFEVNLPQTVVKEILTDLKNENITPNLYAKAEATIVQLMSTDSFMRFKRSPQFEKFLKDVKCYDLGMSQTEEKQMQDQMQKVEKEKKVKSRERMHTVHGTSAEAAVSMVAEAMLEDVSHPVGESHTLIQHSESE